MVFVVKRYQFSFIMKRRKARDLTHFGTKQVSVLYLKMDKFNAELKDIWLDFVAEVVYWHLTHCRYGTCFKRAFTLP